MLHLLLGKIIGCLIQEQLATWLIEKMFFEEFTDNVDGAVYFADQSKIKSAWHNQA